ncbi:KTSC domain-containing protein [Burkholderia anthina]|uniref:KTSC domain-containing protein n=1 Tax=Burkholderia anthina TaxID=179879 RepID=UPI001AA08213|nr:KTSC domain-containing protein [Burkholderia anthina]QTD88767.1 KTSC domain-containing protein [Burkholderia anthina]
MTTTAVAIPLREVESSQIHAIGHDAESQTLAIQFKSKAGAGSIYHYSQFPADEFEKFAGAESIGRYFGQHIKPFPDRYPFQKIGG